MLIRFFIIIVIATLGCTQVNSIPINQNLEKEQIGFQEVLLKAHNKERTKNGCKPLVLNKELCEYAQKHSEYMAKNKKLLHSKMLDLQEVNKESNVVGENIAWGQETEKSVFSSWMLSPMHRWNILYDSYSKVGFGLKKDKNNTNYWCAVFSN